MRKLLWKVFALSIVLLGAIQLRAQDQASITGTVTDPTGAEIPAAAVTLENPSTSVSYKTTTNGQGSYTFTNVQAGPGYKLTIEAPGFKTTTLTGIYLNVSATRTQNVKLTVGATAQTVEVSASAQTVTLNTTDATVGNNFQVQFMQDLPVENRDSPAALFTMQPGVTLDGAVTGARTDQSNVTLDGLEVNDDATGQFGAIVGNAPVDSVQEFRGTTAGQLSSAGQGGGGQYSLVTRSGTNQFHGNVNEYHRDTDLEANDWFNNNSGVGRSPLIRNQFGGNIGGPIWRNKAFFFFDWDSRKDTLSNLVERTVPMGTNTSGYRGGNVSYVGTGGAIETLDATQVASYDPTGAGWNSSELSLFQSRYPIANDLSGGYGDLVNTAGYRFNAPFPYTENDFVQRIDFNLNDKMKIFGRGTVDRENATESAIQFPGDPVTYPFYDRSTAWVVGHTWTINDHMLNQASYGETLEDFSFNVTYNPQGANQYGFSGLPSSGPYGGGNNSQARTFPVPMVRDDFSWEKGKHSFTFGGTFKWKTPDGFAAENFNFPSVGVAGNTYLTALSPAQRPSDLDPDSQYYTTIYDSLYSTALGVVPVVNSNFSYNNKGQVQPQGSGLSLKYRNYETEVYFGDTWKVTPNLDISYGVRYQNYTVPYEVHGNEAITNMVQDGKVSDFTWDTFWKDREAQSAAGNTAPDGLPFLQFLYGGKANNQPSYYQPSNKNFAPSVAFAYSPSWDKKSVFRAGASLKYDYSLINALQFQQLQTSYLFEASNTNLFGTPGDATATLMDAPRFAGLSSPPPPPAAPTIVTPFVPFVDGSGTPYGLPNSEFNLMMDTKLKTPYNIALDFGFQHEFPQGYILKMDYVGRLGRRLLATADASQLLDFPDSTGGSTQTMGQAMGSLTTQLRQNAGLGPVGAIYAVNPVPWFEDMLPGLNNLVNYYYGTSLTNTAQAIAYFAYPLPQRGDFADTIQALSNVGLPTNVGMASQFSSNSVWTNKGSSNYNGLLVTLHKNAGYGLQFDLNYTWSHSIDNVSAISNFIASSQGFGWICDVQRPRECRGNSEFDVANYLNGNFIYELPFGQGKTFAATIPFWANEIVGGWEISGLPSWHTGNAYNMYSNAYVTSYANNAAATLLGSPALLKAKVNGGKGAAVNAFENPTGALAAFTGPTGFDIGQRNNLRGPGFFNIDMGLGKNFPVWTDKATLKFRCDAFNALNHPSFNTPSANDITQANGVPFGTISSTASSPRVLQLSLRLEF